MRMQKPSGILVLSLTLAVPPPRLVPVPDEEKELRNIRIHDDGSAISMGDIHMKFTFGRKP